MTDPEKILRYRIGEYLGVHPDAVEDLMTGAQMAEFDSYFAWCDTRRDKFDFYLAQIAGYSSGKARFKIHEFFAPDGAGRGKVLKASEAIPILKGMYGNGKAQSMADS